MELCLVEVKIETPSFPYGRRAVCVESVRCCVGVGMHSVVLWDLASRRGWRPWLTLEGRDLREPNPPAVCYKGCSDKKYDRSDGSIENPSEFGLSIHFVTVSSSTIQSDMQYLKREKMNIWVHFTGIMYECGRMLIFFTVTTTKGILQ